MPKSLGTLTTVGNLAFTQYITDNPKWSQEQDYELLPDKFNIPLLKSLSGDSLDQEVEQIIPEKCRFKIISPELYFLGKKRYALIKLSEGSVGFIPINVIRKPVVRKSGMSGELLAIQTLDALIKQENKPITIKIQNRFVAANIVACLNISGTPKADFSLENRGCCNVVFISHKTGSSSQHFSQYSGVSIKSGEEIYNHKEVQSFLKTCTKYLVDNKLQNPLYKEIKDEDLIRMAIFGPNYGSKRYGINNVHLLAQGLPSLEKTRIENTFMLKWSQHEILSGDIKNLEGDYRAVLGATFKSGRVILLGGVSYEGLRAGIYPFGYFKGRFGLIKCK